VRLARVRVTRLGRSSSHGALPSHAGLPIGRNNENACRELSGEVKRTELGLSCNPDGPARREENWSAADGFVLIPVLLALGVFGFVAMLLTETVANEVKANARLLRQAEAEAWANGLVQLTAYQLAAGGDSIARGALPVNGTPLTCRIGKGTATIEVLDAAGLVDINFAPPDVLEQLFVGLEAPQGEAAQLSANITDFRGLDAIGDSKMAEYLEEGRAFGPKNSPFATVGELEQVLGMTRMLFSRVRPFVTVQSRMPYIDSNVASNQMLAMQLPNAFELPVAKTRTFVVRASAHNAGRTHFVREAAVELSQRAASGFLLREWNRLEAYGEGYPPADDSTEACLDVLLSR
jgi:general secretion pathway protein K